VNKSEIQLILNGKKVIFRITNTDSLVFNIKCFLLLSSEEQNRVARLVEKIKALRRLLEGSNLAPLRNFERIR
jgi:hypothetical protein